MKTMLKTTDSPTFAEAATAAWVPSLRLPVNDAGRLGSAVPLAERCVR